MVGVIVVLACIAMGCIIAGWPPECQHPVAKLAPCVHGQGCEVPPPGWWCSREPGHKGPCAARRVVMECVFCGVEVA
jgi:hypothetical protein